MSDPDPWACAVCGEVMPVQDMARQCEASHEAETDEQETSP